MSFIEEFKRRNVVRVGVACAVITRVFAQISEIAVLPFVNLSNEDDFFPGGQTENIYLSPVAIQHGNIE
jgi:TolB-like protein